MTNPKLGIVLSGGGAKGAYEAGFLKALAELNIEPHAISGTSIGALNGSVYAAQRDTQSVSSMLGEIWQEMARSKALKVDGKKAFLNIAEVVSYFSPLAPLSRGVKIAAGIVRGSSNKDGILSVEPAENILKKYASTEALKQGLPFYVGVTESKGNMIDSLRLLGLSKSGLTEYVKVQSLAQEDMHKTILASAALPFLFDSIKVKGKSYRDGCLSSLNNSGGNTPAKPLIENEKCTHLVVCHLDNGSFFNRHEFKDTSIIEIRPKFGTFSSVLDPLRFSVDKIDIWMEQGYLDSIRILKDAFDTLDGKYKRIRSEQFSDMALKELQDNNFHIPRDS